jgi:hypothetical protein
MTVNTEKNSKVSRAFNAGKAFSKAAKVPLTVAGAGASNFLRSGLVGTGLGFAAATVCAGGAAKNVAEGGCRYY